MGLQLSGSVQLEGNLLVTGSANSVFENISVTNRITANEINVQFVSSSIIYSSGSNRFGDLITDTQQFTGSLQVSGSSHHILGNLALGTTTADVFSRGDQRNVGISVFGASENMALQLNAGGSAGRGAQIYMGQGGTRHFTLSSNVTETRVGTTTNTPLILTTNDTGRLTISGSTIGVGTATPTSIGTYYTTLELKGKSGGTGNEGGYYLTTDADGSTTGQFGVDGNFVYMGSRSNTDAIITTNNTERVRITSSEVQINNGTRYWNINPASAAIRHVTGGVVEAQFDPSVGGNSWLGATSGTTGAGAKHYFSSTGAATFAGSVTATSATLSGPLNLGGNTVYSNWGTPANVNNGATTTFTYTQAAGEFQVQFQYNILGLYAPSGTNLNGYASGIVHFMADGSTNNAAVSSIGASGWTVTASATNAGEYTITFTNSSGATMTNVNYRITKLNRTGLG
jgi:hypothetical protein